MGNGKVGRSMHARSAPPCTLSSKTALSSYSEDRFFLSNLYVNETTIGSGNGLPLGSFTVANGSSLPFFNSP